MHCTHDAQQVATASTAPVVPTVGDSAARARIEAVAKAHFDLLRLADAIKVVRFTAFDEHDNTNDYAPQEGARFRISGTAPDCLTWHRHPDILDVYYDIDPIEPSMVDPGLRTWSCFGRSFFPDGTHEPGDCGDIVAVWASQEPVAARLAALGYPVVRSQAPDA